MANKYISNNNGQLKEIEATAVSTGASDANKIVALDPTTGRLNESLMPTGIGADTASITASEALTAGDLVNIWDSLGAKARKADATTTGKFAMGYVKANVAQGALATVYFEGSNDQVIGKTAGIQYLSTTAGQTTSTAPSGSGNVVQVVGFATSATNINFQSGTPLVLA